MISSPKMPAVTPPAEVESEPEDPGLSPKALKRSRTLASQVARLSGEAPTAVQARAMNKSPDDPTSFLRGELRSNRLKARDERRAQAAADRATKTAGKGTGGRGRGRASTILTALNGQLPDTASVRKTLLGGS